MIELGCGSLGGFVPSLMRAGYAVVGVDPEAPAGSQYRHVRFEQYAPPTAVDAVVASTSLHHVGRLDEVLDGIASVLVPGGLLVVIEWAWERFDDATAQS